MPVFEGIVAAALPKKEVVTPAQPSVTQPQPALSVPLSPEAPVSLITDTDRRNKRLRSENLSTPSISGMLNGTGSPGVSEPDPRLSKEVKLLKEELFDAGQLTKAWKDFAETVDAAQLRSALSVREPVIHDNFCVVYNLDNEVQRQRITQDLKPKLLAYLHKIMHNDHITVEFNVTENLEEIINKPYTDQEKFNTLAAKYPILGQMKNRFGLDFE